MTVTTQLNPARGAVAAQIIISISGRVLERKDIGAVLKALREDVIGTVVKPLVVAKDSYTQIKIALPKDTSDERAYLIRERIATVAAEALSR